MGCCGKKRRRFLSRVKKAKAPQKQKLTDIPDKELTPRQIRIKNRMLRMEARKKRIAARNARTMRMKAHNDRKALDN